jgi:general secretion pathway protein F
MGPTQFAYRAAHGHGAIERGILTAETRDAAAAALMNRGLFLIELTADETTGRKKKRLPSDDLAVGLRILAALLEANLPISRALHMLDSLVPISWTPVLASITQSIREGCGVAEALAASPASFPSVVIGVLQAGEGGSGIALAVDRAARLMESAARTRSAIRSALAYPIILAGAGMASVALLVGVVLPRFGAILADLGQPLPASTQAVLSLSGAARLAALPVLILVVIAGLLWRSWVSTESGRRQWDTNLLSLPFLGAIRMSSATARACEALSALLESGVPVTQALVFGARASGDNAIEARIMAARDLIVDGQSVASSLDFHRAMTITAIRLARAGEETGRLGAMLGHAATLEDQAANRSIRSFVRALEPAMILLFGGIVALVAASLLQAIYSVRPT